MTVQARSPTIDYIENGTTRAFAAAFRFKAAGDLRVSRSTAAGVRTALTLGLDYTVAGGETDAGGTVTVTAPAAAGTRLRIRRVTPRQQEAVYTTGDRFPAKLTEGALDTLTMIAQDQFVGLQDLRETSVQAPEGEVIGRLPGLPLRASKLPTFNALGDFGTLPPIPGQTGIVTLAPSGKPQAMRLSDLGIARDAIFDGGFDGVAGGDDFDGGYDGVA